MKRSPLLNWKQKDGKSTTSSQSSQMIHDEAENNEKWSAAGDVPSF
jgi:hypothetical protein